MLFILFCFTSPVSIFSFFLFSFFLFSFFLFLSLLLATNSLSLLLIPLSWFCRCQHDLGSRRNRRSRVELSVYLLSPSPFSFLLSHTCVLRFCYWCRDKNKAETRIRQRQRGVNLESKCIPGSMTVDLLYSWSHSLSSRFLTLCQLQSSSS